MEKAIEYRILAAQLRREAAQLALANPRQVKLRAAERWESLATEIERVVAPSVARASHGWIF